MLNIILITPILGLLRNYSKYKTIKPLLFIRTPFIYFFLFILIQTNNIWKILIFERWLMLSIKTIISIYNMDYYYKKQKYIKKYGIKYK